MRRPPKKRPSMSRNARMACFFSEKARKTRTASSSGAWGARKTSSASTAPYLPHSDRVSFRNSASISSGATMFFSRSTRVGVFNGRDASVGTMFGCADGAAAGAGATSPSSNADSKGAASGSGAGAGFGGSALRVFIHAGKLDTPRPRPIWFPLPRPRPLMAPRSPDSIARFAARCRSSARRACSASSFSRCTWRCFSRRS
mmetsp:Transcript_21564/g.74433  ORF Transcript_21564/g.74433 Transcript_21564/m.74433 type:complete len:201 (-) Transcript_21564:259-861(-)